MAILLGLVLVIFFGFSAMIFGAFWIFTAKYKPDSLWKVNHSAGIIKDAILAIFGVFAFLIIINILLFILDAVSYMLKQN